MLWQAIAHKAKRDGKEVSMLGNPQGKLHWCLLNFFSVAIEF